MKIIHTRYALIFRFKSLQSQDQELLALKWGTMVNSLHKLSTALEESKISTSASHAGLLKEIEKILRSQIRTKTLTDDAFVYMSLLINEDAPKNAAELSSLISDFMTDGMSYTDEEAYKQCEHIIKVLHE